MDDLNSTSEQQHYHSSSLNIQPWSLAINRPGQISSGSHSNDILLTEPRFPPVFQLTQQSIPFDYSNFTGVQLLSILRLCDDHRNALFFRWHPTFLQEFTSQSIPFPFPVDPSQPSEACHNPIDHEDAMYLEREDIINLVDQCRAILTAYHHFELYASIAFTFIQAEYRQAKHLPKYYPHLPLFSPIERFNTLCTVLKANQQLFNQLCGTQSSVLNDIPYIDSIAVLDVCPPPSLDCFRRCTVILKQFFREWSCEGKQERIECFEPILMAITSLYPPVIRHDLPSHALSLTNDALRTIEARCTSRRPSSPPPAGDMLPPRVLVPGAGLGRLAWEMAQLGFDVDINESSQYMLLPMRWLLDPGANPTPTTTYTTAPVDDPASHNQGINPIHPMKHITPCLISPWVLERANWLSFNHRIKSFMIPDVHPFTGTAMTSELLSVSSPSPPLSLSSSGEKPEGSLINTHDVHHRSPSPTTATTTSPLQCSNTFTIMQGPFLEAFANMADPTLDDQLKYDVVVTCFFLDTSRNIIQYIDCIRQCLKPGGHWINVGPLHYHFALGDTSIPLASDDDNDTHTQSAHTSNQYDDINLTLPFDEILTILPSFDFKVIEQRMSVASYTQHPENLYTNRFQTIFFVAQKQP